MQNKHDLPREKLNKKGAESLTDIELLQAVIGSGGKGNDYKPSPQRKGNIYSDAYYLRGGGFKIEYINK